MTKGHRVARSTLKTSKAVRKLFPWAQVVVKVDGLRVAYECPEDALEEHGKGFGWPHTSKIPAPHSDVTNVRVHSQSHALLVKAKRRGDL